MAMGQVINPATNIGTIPGTPAGVAGTATTVNTAAPTAAVPSINGPSAVAQTNPYAAPASAGGTVPATPSTNPSLITATGNPSTIQSNGINYADGSKTLTGDLKDVNGAGTGTALSQAIQGLGTVNSSAVQATIANTDLAAGKQLANIQSQEGQAGVTANSSTAALAEGDFYTGVNAQLQQTIGGIEQNQQTQLIQTLMDEGKAHGPDESTLDSIMNGITDAGEIGGAIFGL